jgi:hypothetical protein
MKAIKQHTRTVKYEGQPVFIAWDLWFIIIRTARNRERKTPALVFGSKTPPGITDNLFYN